MIERTNEELARYLENHSRITYNPSAAVVLREAAARLRANDGERPVGDGAREALTQKEWDLVINISPSGQYSLDESRAIYKAQMKLKHALASQAPAQKKSSTLTGKLHK